MPTPEQIARKTLIDPQLIDAGWSPIVPYDTTTSRQLVALEEYPTATGPVDYALFHQDEPLALVEAKKAGVGVQNVLSQAQRYAKGFDGSPWDWHGYKVPFIYSTNGHQIRFQDLRLPMSRSRLVAHFHTPAALRELLALDQAQVWRTLQAMPIQFAGLRPYQHDAITAVEAALVTDKRRLLVAMATGTGKTITTIALLYRLLKAGAAKRVLFLVDRRALAAQAVNAFNQFDAEPGLKFSRTYEVYSQRFRPNETDSTFDPKVLPTSYLTNPDGRTAFVYITTIQRMHMNLFGSAWDDVEETEDDASQLSIPIHAFDLIVADESHRGYTASEEGAWRKVLDHFDAVKIGLTATPAAHTVAYFGDMVYQYGYEQAVRDGYLVDYEPRVIRSDVTINGAFLRPEEEVLFKNRDTGEQRYELLDDERELPSPSLEREWSSPDRDRKIVQEIVTYLKELERERGRFPKTLVFASNDIAHISHADRLVELFRDQLGQGDRFVEKITGSSSVDRPLQRIREFRNRPLPGVVVTVDMLSTGVDIPSLEAIVLLRPIKSRILFEQIMGRGTRLSRAINKTHFIVFDALGVLDYFANASGFTVEPLERQLRPLGDIINDIANNVDRKRNVQSLVQRLQRVARNITWEGRDLFKPFIPDGDIEAWATNLPNLIRTDFVNTIKILKDPRFQHVMTTYPREKSPFLIAESVQDTVTSGYLIHTIDGRHVRPDDYLSAFVTFIHDQADQLDALRILLDQPADWNGAVLSSLRMTLANAPEGFTLDKLRRAYKDELADIISLVKNAARGEPLVSAQARVERAMTTIRAGRTFTPEQERWLTLIQNHLIENLAIDPESFQLLTFQRAGATWNRVNRDFDGDLATLLREINYALIVE